MANSNTNIVRQGFLYEDTYGNKAKDANLTFFIDFIYEYLGESKSIFEKKYGKLKGEIKPDILSKIKIKVDKILDTFKKRITYKKKYIKDLYRKQIINNYPETDLKTSFQGLLDLTKKMNNNIVKNFTDKMIKKGDMKIALTEAEFGFDKMNMVDTMSDFVEGAARFFKKIFGDKYKDIKFKLDKGYFAEVYNKYNKMKNPTVENLREFKNDLILTLNNTCDFIEKAFNEEIDKTKTQFTVDNIKKYLETNEK